MKEEKYNEFKRVISMTISEIDYHRHNRFQKTFGTITQQDVEDVFSDDSKIFEYAKKGRAVVEDDGRRYDLCLNDFRALAGLLALSSQIHCPIIEIAEVAFLAGFNRGVQYSKNRSKKKPTAKKSKAA